MANAEWVEWIADAEVGLLNYSNINRSAFDSDKRDDSAFIPAISLGRYNQLTDSTRLRATADFEAGLYNKFELLNYSKAGAALAVRQKLGFGSDASWLRPHFSVEYMDVGEDIRDSLLYEAGVHIGKQLMPRLDGQIGYIYTLRDGKNDVFDQKGHTLSLEMGYMLIDRLLLTAGYFYRYGDFDSAYSPYNYTQTCDAQAITKAFTDYFYTYRLAGRTNTIAVAASYSLLNGHGSLNIGYQRDDGKANALDYVDDIVRASFIYSY